MQEGLRLLIKAIWEAGPKVMPSRTQCSLVRHDRKGAHLVVESTIGEKESLKLCATNIASNRCVPHLVCSSSIIIFLSQLQESRNTTYISNTKG